MISQVLLKELDIPRRVLKKVTQFLLIARLACKTTRFPSFTYFRVLLQNIRICQQRRYTPIEAFRLGCFSPDFNAFLIDKFISRKVLSKIQEKLNPPSWAELLKNKALFYNYCLEAKIRVPQWYVMSVPEKLFWYCHNNRLLSSLDDQADFIKHELPDSFVIKPIRGAYGDRVIIVSKMGEDFKNTNGDSYSALNLVRYIQAHYPEGFVIQQRIQNHPAIVDLTGSEALQTVRIISMMDNDGNCHIIHAHFKPITKPGVFIDTYLEGLTGNVEAPVDIDKGTLGTGNYLTSTGQGIKMVSEHPLTGKSFRGFKLPGWYEACGVVKQAAHKFLPIRTIGWDVALSPAGPYIIEANIWWDPPNQHVRMQEILKALEEMSYSSDTG